MLRTLKDLFDAIAPPKANDPRQREHALHLASAVLLVEVMRADGHFDAAERAAAIAALRDRLGLADDELARLLELAEETARTAHDYHSFTSRINEAYEPDEKLRIVADMWTVAYADGRLADHELHTMWRLADLLHVPRGAYLAAKARARQAAGLD